jgi:hypothetical protein
MPNWGASTTLNRQGTIQLSLLVGLWKGGHPPDRPFNAWFGPWHEILIFLYVKFVATPRADTVPSCDEDLSVW